MFSSTLCLCTCMRRHVLPMAYMCISRLITAAGKLFPLRAALHNTTSCVLIIHLFPSEPTHTINGRENCPAVSTVGQVRSVYPSPPITHLQQRPLAASIPDSSSASCVSDSHTQRHWGSLGSASCSQGTGQKAGAVAAMFQNSCVTFPCSLDVTYYRGCQELPHSLITQPTHVCKNTSTPLLMQ
jgi:hypothetical protein